MPFTYFPDFFHYCLFPLLTTSSLQSDELPHGMTLSKWPIRHYELFAGLCLLHNAPLSASTAQSIPFNFVTCWLLLRNTIYGTGRESLTTLYELERQRKHGDKFASRYSIGDFCRSPVCRLWYVVLR